MLNSADMQPTAKFSVVIPVHNSSRTLRKTLQTVQSQGDHNLEVVVVDDGSTDEIGPMVQAFGYHHHRLPMNVGPAVARTEGAKVATGEILLFTDSDVWLPDGTVDKIRATFAERGCQCVQGTFSKQCPQTNFFSQYKNLYNRYVLSLLGDWISTTYTSITAIKREFFFECGGFDVNISEASVEDRTLGENILHAGGKIYLDKGLEVIHDKQLDASKFFRSQFHRSADLAKLYLRQKESGFLKGTQSFGTNSRQAMARLPIVGMVLLSLIASLVSPLSLMVTVIALALYVKLSYRWFHYLANEKGIWFALKGWVTDFADAIVSGLGVAKGFYEYKLKKLRY